MSQKEELRHRVEARKLEFESRVAKARADAAGTQNEIARKAQAKLDELEKHLKDGWEDLSEEAARKLNEWLQ